MPHDESTPARERRAFPARRRHNAIAVLLSQHRRRKSTGRRKEDKVGYVDVYGPRVWVFVCSVLFLSALDAVLTHKEISSGLVREANPVMSAVMAWGGMFSFYGVKAGMTALPLGVLVLHKEWPVAKFTARVCLWCYILVALYHFFLYFFLSR